MTNPTPPNQPPYQPQPQPQQGQYPPPQGGYQPQGGFQQPPPYQGQQQGPPPYQGQQGPPPTGGPMPPMAPLPPRRGMSGAVKLIIALVAVGGLAAVIGLGVLLSQGSPDSAKAGDCVARDGENSVKVVGCSDSGAAYKVVGKVEDQSQVAFTLRSRTICRPFQGATTAFWKGEQGGEGYVLCLAPNR